MKTLVSITCVVGIVWLTKQLAPPQGIPGAETFYVVAGIVVLGALLLALVSSRSKEM